MKAIVQILFLSTLAVVATSCSTANIGQVEPGKITVEFCHFPLEKKLKQLNASFYLIFRFEVDGSGFPKSLEVRQNNFISQQDVLDCIQHWQFPLYLEGKTVAAIQHWQHGVGWEGLSIIGAGPKLEIRDSGDPCPYRQCGQGPKESLPDQWGI